MKAVRPSAFALHRPISIHLYPIGTRYRGYHGKSEEILDCIQRMQLYGYAAGGYAVIGHLVFECTVSSHLQSIVAFTSYA